MSSQLHLVAGGELPPSYESVVSCDMPPPYWSVLVSDGKLMSGLPVAAPKQATGWTNCYHGRHSERLWKISSWEESIYLNTTSRPMLTSWNLIVIVLVRRVNIVMEEQVELQCGTGITLFVVTSGRIRLGSALCERWSDVWELLGTWRAAVPSTFSNVEY